jgi:hypothetical protein
MTALSDDERADLQRIAEEARLRLTEAINASEAPSARLSPHDAPAPFIPPLGLTRPVPAEPLPVRPWWCGGCGDPGPWRPYAYCDGCAEVDRRKRLAARLEVVRQALPPSSEGATLGAKWLQDLVGPDAHAKALAYLRMLHAGERSVHPAWLLLEGQSRMGKTSLAAAIFRALAGRAGREGTPEAVVSLAFGMRFVATWRLRKAQQEHALGKGEAPLLHEAAKATLLVLDDLGNEGVDRGQAVADLLFARHEGRAPTVVTTGLSREELEARYGVALKNRLIESTTVQLGEQKP